MKLTVIAIGKLKEKYFAEAAAEYVKRCSRYADVSVVELAEAPQGKSPAEQQQIEGESLLARSKGYVVALDMRGDMLSSEQLAAALDKRFSSGVSEMSFLIGGSHGLSPQVRERADAVLSFSKATFPHQLFRVMLLEQLYRALCINAGTPYHK